MADNISPELIGIYNNGVRGNGGGGGSGLTVSVTISEATLTTPGGVQTRNSSDGTVTSETVSVVPTQYYVQNEISRLESAIVSGGGSGVTVVQSAYGGPFAVTTSGSNITVAGGRMYLGGTEYTVASSTLTSANGTVYYYLYYSGGSYYSGCSVAASAGALSDNIRGSQGYYTALANVQGGNVTQCHYGDITIEGRVS